MEVESGKVNVERWRDMGVAGTEPRWQHGMGRGRGGMVPDHGKLMSMDIRIHA